MQSLERKQQMSSLRIKHTHFRDRGGGEKGVNATSHFTVHTVESLNKDRQGRKDKIYGE